MKKMATAGYSSVRPKSHSVRTSRGIVDNMTFPGLFSRACPIALCENARRCNQHPCSNR